LFEFLAPVFRSRTRCHSFGQDGHQTHLQGDKGFRKGKRQALEVRVLTDVENPIQSKNEKEIRK
jgi:hypothetical protein